eukprot:892264-Amphidinium_carterae.1
MEKTIGFWSIHDPNASFLLAFGLSDAHGLELAPDAGVLVRSCLCVCFQPHWSCMSLITSPFLTIHIYTASKRDMSAATCHLRFIEP